MDVSLLSIKLLSPMCIRPHALVLGTFSTLVLEALVLPSSHLSRHAPLLDCIYRLPKQGLYGGWCLSLHFSFFLAFPSSGSPPGRTSFFLLVWLFLLNLIFFFFQRNKFVPGDRVVHGTSDVFHCEGISTDYVIEHFKWIPMYPGPLESGNFGSSFMDLPVPELIQRMEDQTIQIEYYGQWKRAVVETVRFFFVFSNHMLLIFPSILVCLTKDWVLLHPLSLHLLHQVANTVFSQFRDPTASPSPPLSLS